MNKSGYLSSVCVLALAWTLSGCSGSQIHQAAEAPSPAAASDHDSSAAQPGTFYSSVSLANSYNSLQQLNDASAVIAELHIEKIESTSERLDSTYYSAAIRELIHSETHTLQNGDHIIVKQSGIALEGEREGKVNVVREAPLLNAGDDVILFLKQHPTDEHIYYIAGEYQGNYKVKNGKVYSANPEQPAESPGLSEEQTDGEASRVVIGLDVEQFKRNIGKLNKEADK